ncbi:hypothetical protein HK407_01g01040 [Ordospora pajunii]|uniref:uncharacterized protein n=1 Tax=Ordospora pajunii TaxID=3039483 RepID=UPI0029526407|nr:uncharacterized protein HK407_01g01040 [Ordospora pajunii]KAH9412211.1 hypothetical protein HK407_01g01040 [Ordospora pajunii]
METVFRNDLGEGNKTVLDVSQMLCISYRSRIMAQIIFQKVYPRFFKKEGHTIVAIASVYLSAKINEALVKPDVLFEMISRNMPAGTALSRDRLVSVECKIIEMIEFQFNVCPAQLFLMRVGKTLGIDVSRKLLALDEIHGDSRANFIKYFDGMYDPEVVALSVLGDEEVRLFECYFGVRIDRGLVEEVRSIMTKK